MNRARILLLSANPDSTAHLALDKEVRAIQVRLRQSGAADRIELCAEWALHGDELPAALMRHRPRVVHFSGHGSSAGELILNASESGEVNPVGAETLRRIFEPLAADISCVVLNACYSALQAEVLSQILPCVVGMSNAVKDTAAVAFAAGFYEALAFGESVQTAFKLGCAQIELAQEGEQRELPTLLLRPGTDPAQLRPFAAAAAGSKPQAANSAPMLQPPSKRVGTLILLLACFAVSAFFIVDSLYTRRSNSEKEEYRKLLNVRADEIQLVLKNADDTPALHVFQTLHQANLEAIKDDNLILSHELTSRIHHLLARRDRNQQDSASKDGLVLAEGERKFPAMPSLFADTKDLDYLKGLAAPDKGLPGQRQKSASGPSARTVLLVKYFGLARDLRNKLGKEDQTVSGDKTSEARAQPYLPDSEQEKILLYGNKAGLHEYLPLSDIRKTLRDLDLSVCKEQGASHVVRLTLTIDRSGVVSSSSASPSGGPGSECVANKVKNASFGKFSGDPMTLTYPFIIRSEGSAPAFDDTIDDIQ